MASKSHQRAIQKYRGRLAKTGMARFEVLGLDSDRQIIRVLAKRLAARDADASEIRASIHRAVAGKRTGAGGILASLRRSPLVGADLTIGRKHEPGRKVRL